MLADVFSWIAFWVVSVVLSLVRVLSILYITRLIFSLVPRMAEHPIGRALAQFFDRVLTPIRSVLPKNGLVDLSGLAFLFLLLATKLLIAAVYPELT